MRTIRSGLLVLGIVVVLLLIPTAGQACPKCFASANKQVLHAYYVSVLFMSLIPFGVVGSILAWLFFRMRTRSRPGEPSGLPAQDSVLKEIGQGNKTVSAR